MREDYSVSINFLPILQDKFSFTVYRLEDQGQRKTNLPANVVRRSLPIDHDSIDERKKYWISLNRLEGFEAFNCENHYNLYLTRDFLHKRLIASCEKANLTIAFEERGFARSRVVFILLTHQEGEESIWLRSFYLGTLGKFGFLIDFRFRKHHDIPFSKRVQQLSLSLDQYGKENRSFYVDRHKKVQDFINLYFESIFPLSYGEHFLEVVPKLMRLQAKNLDTKKYVFCDDQIDKSQFMGLRRFHPLNGLSQAPTIFFVYRQEDLSIRARKCTDRFRQRCSTRFHPKCSTRFWPRWSTTDRVRKLQKKHSSTQRKRKTRITEARFFS
jgi:hypothetical protein